MRLALAVLGLALLTASTAGAAPNPATWVRRVGAGVEPNLGKSLPAMVGEVWVDWEPGVGEATREAARGAVDGATLQVVPGTTVEIVLVAEGTETAAIQQLSGRDGIRQATINAVGSWSQSGTLNRFEPNDTMWASQREIHDLTRTPEAWALMVPPGSAAGTPPLVGSPEIVIAIMDSGMQVTHPELASNVWVNADEIPGNSIDDDGNGYVDDVNGYNFGDGNADLTDNVGHGTACAGVAAAIGNNGVAMAGQAWRCRVMCAKLGDLPAASSTLAATTYAIDNGADVVSMSFSAGVTYDAITREFTRGFSTSGFPAYGGRYRSGVVFCAAMGNSNYDTQDQTPVTCETDLNEVLGVCAVDKTGKRSIWAAGVSESCYSSRPGVADLSAPGGAANEDYIALAVQATASDPLYVTDFGGTSAATPYAAGIAALVRSASPDLSAAEVNEVLRDSANGTLLYQQNPTFIEGKKLGEGIVDAYASVDAVTQFSALAAVVSPANGGHVANTTPTIVVSARRKASRAPLLTRVTVRIDPAAGSTPSDEDAVWLDRVGNTPGSTDAPDGIDDLTNETYPGDGLFSVRVPSPLSVGASGTGVHTVEVTVEDDRDPVEPVTATSRFRVVAVGLNAGRQMVSVPLVLYGAGNTANARPAAVLAQAVGEAGDAQIARWDPTGGDPRNPGRYVRSDVDGADAAYISVMVPGKAYWVDLPVETSRLMLQGEEVPSDIWLIRDAPYGDTSTGADYLAPGWHQIGNPFPYEVSLTAFLVDTTDGRRIPLAAAAQEGICRGVLYEYAGGQYVPTVIPNAVLKPFSGYWFRTLKQCKLYAVPETATASASARKVSSLAGWSVDVTASLADGRSTVSLAASPAATEAFDAGVDVEQPPALGTVVLASLAPAKGTTDSLLRDVRGEGANAMTWNLRVAAGRDGEAVLEWGDVRGVPRDYSVSLTDVATGRCVSLRHLSEYRYEAEAGTTREFTITATRAVGAGLGIQVLSGETLRAVTTVTFRLSQDADVTCRVLNAAGRVVRTATESAATPAGMRSLSWDGRDDRGALVPSGTYRLVVEARSGSGEVARGSVSVSR